MVGRTGAHNALASVMVMVATAMVLNLVPSSAGAELHSNTRGGWLVGFAVGGGTAGVSVDGESAGDREGGAAGFFRAGYAFNPQLSLELNSNGWTKEESGVTLTFTSSTAALNYYPGSSGLVLRGGLGLGTVKASVSAGGATVSAEESGFAFNGGAAYEFRVMRTFALGPQVDFGWATVDSFDANWVNFGL